MSVDMFETKHKRDKAAEIVGLHPRTLTQKAADGEIEFIRSGNANLYPESSLRAYLDRVTFEAKPETARNSKASRNPNRSRRKN